MELVPVFDDVEGVCMIGFVKIIKCELRTSEYLGACRYVRIHVSDGAVQLPLPNLSAQHAFLCVLVSSIYYNPRCPYQRPHWMRKTLVFSSMKKTVKNLPKFLSPLENPQYSDRLCSRNQFRTYMLRDLMRR